ncbi:hypothetical protein BDZ89DRAFT_1050614 [Hymenopellis radicata]|nr:hypothetical protein BDZ89DRAFT_1050614 [Hymenopellis radicata]
MPLPPAPPLDADTLDADTPVVHPLRRMIRFADVFPTLGACSFFGSSASQLFRKEGTLSDVHGGDVSLAKPVKAEEPKDIFDLATFAEVCGSTRKRIIIKNTNYDVVSYTLQSDVKPNVKWVATPPDLDAKAGTRSTAVTFVVWTNPSQSETAIWQYSPKRPHWHSVELGTAYQSGSWMRDEGGTYTLQLRDNAAILIKQATARRNYPSV